MNATIYIRGNPVDYDRWAELGNEGWGWEDVLPYFKRSEHFTGSGVNPEEYGTDGPLNVADQHSPQDLSRTFVDAAVATGYGANHRLQWAQQDGFGLFHVTQKDGRRQSAAYLKPALDRPNLAAETGAHVTRVLFEGDRAVGVAYEQDGRRVRPTGGRRLCGQAGRGRTRPRPRTHRASQARGRLWTRSRLCLSNRPRTVRRGTPNRRDRRRP